MIRWFILCVILFTSPYVGAQNDEVTETVSFPSVTQVNDSVREQYIKPFPDHFFVYPVLKQRTLNFTLAKADRSSILTYKPNYAYNLGLGVYLFEVGLELGVAIPLREQSIQKFGTSNARDIQLNALLKRWGVDAFYQRYGGFFLIDEENKPRHNEPYPQRPDIKTKNFGLTTHYIFNYQKFSFRSAYNYSERQLNSKGSWLLFATLNNFRVAADSSIVSDERQVDFGSAVNFERLRYTTFSIAPGYTYSLIYNHFFLNATLAFGPAHHWINYDLEGSASTHHDIAINSFLGARLAIGYNGFRFFGGISFISQGSTIRFEQVNFSNNNSVFRILVGYRFNEFGILKKRIWEMVPIHI